MYYWIIHSFIHMNTLIFPRCQQTRLNWTIGLTHWGQVTHICVNKLTIIGSDNGLSPDRRQAIIWTNAGLLLIGPLGTYFSEILIEILTFSFKKMRLKVSSAKWRPFCLGLNVLTLFLLFALSIRCLMCVALRDSHTLILAETHRIVLLFPYDCHSMI